ncbi:MAG: T9SS type A sorting domain-containing protein [Bacteroidales bacterium]|nr:T9SS type A sorting domain-containing protein [Bacteroidales bacterium]
MNPSLPNSLPPKSEAKNTIIISGEVSYYSALKDTYFNSIVVAAMNDGEKGMATYINWLQRLEAEGNTIYSLSDGMSPVSHPHISHPISIDISHLNADVYFIKIVTRQGEVVKKVVKQ